MTISWSNLALVAAGGALGAVARYVVGKAVGPGADASFPWHTLLVNATGAFILGLLVVLAARGGWPPWWRPFIAVGILGGYTTFSTFSLEAVELALTGRMTVAASYVVASLFAGLFGAWAGILIGRSIA